MIGIIFNKNSKDTRERVIVALLAIFVLSGIVIAFLSLSDPAFAASDVDGKGSYTAIDVKGMLGVDGDGNVDSGAARGIYTPLLNILDTITTVLLLPLGLLFVSWRMIYLAVFPLMMRMDPLHLVGSTRYSKGHEAANGGISNSRNGKHKATMSNLNSLTKGNGNIFGRERAGKMVGDDPLEGTGTASTNPFLGRINLDSASGTEKVTQCLRMELRALIRGVIVVALLWTIIHMIIVAVGMAVKTAGEFTTISS